MASVYVIDGYNLIWSTEKFGHGSLREQRENLLTFLEAAKPAGSARNQITVVFDGKEDVESPPWIGKVHVMFSKRTDADAVIKDLIDNISNPRIATVVTNDRDISKWVRAARAKVMSCEEFLRMAVKKKKASDEPEKPGTAEADHLNRELLRLWKMD